MGSQSAKATYQAGKQIVGDPVAAAKKIPEGASRFFGKIKNVFSQDEEDTGKTSVSDTIKGVLGVADAKRKLEDSNPH